MLVKKIFQDTTMNISQQQTTVGTGHKQIRTRTLFLAPDNDAVGTRPENACGKLKMALVCM